MSQRRFLYKAIIVALLTLLICIPIAMIRSTISERQYYRQQAISTVEQSYAGKLNVLSPVLVVPFTDIETLIYKNEKGVEQKTSETHQKFWLHFPKNFTAKGALSPNSKFLGIHEIRIYEWNAQLLADFDFTLPDSGSALIKRRIGKPYLSLAMSDSRSVLGSPQITVNGAKQQFIQGAGEHGFAAKHKGVHVDLPSLPMAVPQKLNVQINMLLGGTEQLAIVPLADANRWQVHSPWPHPNFSGSFLPRKSNIATTGFDAQWDVSSLSSSAQAQYRAGKPIAELDHMALNLIDPINIYSQTDRASKYALLFIALTFAGFYLFELLKRLAIHPVQYVLVGLSLAIFFLLLLSLSERITFVYAYLIATASCMVLLAVYLSAVLKSWKRGLGFSAVLCMLYGALYGLLISEDNALVLGTLLLFGVLAAVMMITRRVDWYQLNQSDA